MRVVLVLACAALLALPGSSTAQVSPGPLARAHRDLEGPLSCTKCHGGRDTPMNQLCLDCHREIQWLITAGRGLHATDPGATCSSCHPDHAGSDFDLVKWPEGNRERFDHRRTGWPLAEAHAEAACSDCHATRYRKGEAGRLSPRPAGRAGWVGLETSCVTCHEDVHRTSLGTRCEACHDSRDFAFATRFDHATSRYPLTGAHTEVECTSCHRPPRQNPVLNGDGEPIPVFKPQPFGQCSDCHRDPHAGRLGAGCDGCHVTRGFRIIGRDRFDHERTRYPLRGRHAAVACQDCHRAGAARQWNPGFATCGACHTDAHRGQATIAGRPADCAGCHSVDGFSPGVFSLARHRETRYPLEGRHTRVPCSACHRKAPRGSAGDSLGSARVVIRPASGTCTDCHAEAHGGQFAARPDRGRCESCHKVEGWRPSTFTAAAHATLRVNLEGKHGTIGCAACHGPRRARGLPPIPAASTSAGTAGVVFTGIEVACASCHVDTHQGRFAPEGARPEPRGCPACHDLTAFRPSLVTMAAHQRFSFQLAGAHRAVPCAECHSELHGRPLSSTLGRPDAPAMPFSLKATTCVTCHQSPHRGQFGPAESSCERCHGVEGFRPAPGFRHAEFSAFSLDGAHASVSCDQCHRPAPGRNGTPVVDYGTASSKCESCHLEAPRQ